MNDIFIVTSVINTGNVSWNYCKHRSLYGVEERYVQTLDTIDSIRKYSVDGKILLIEGGKLEENKLEQLKSLCDYLEYLGDDIETYNNCISSNCKGLGDSWLILKGLLYIKKSGQMYRNIYKISGRYQMNENYDPDNISMEKPTFNIDLKTFFFSVPYKLIDVFENNLIIIIQILRQYGYICLEELLPKSFHEKLLVETIGCQGFIAIDKTITQA